MHRMTDYLALLRNGDTFEAVLAVLESDLPFEVVPDTRPKAKTMAEVYRRADDISLVPDSPHDEAIDDFYVAMGDGFITEDQYRHVCELIWRQ